MLTSQLFTNPPNKRLRDCEVSDPAHIGPGDPGGDHVARIQEALIRLGKAGKLSNPPLESEKGKFGPTTKNAVLEFKDRNQILQPWQTEPDPFVGKRTIKALDEEMRKLESPAPTPPPPPTNPDLPLDIFVYFRGAPPELQGTRDTTVEAGFKKAFNTDEYLKTHQPAVPICIFGGRGATDHSREAVAEVLALRAKTKAGVTVVRGDSIGAMTALNAASQLTQKSVKLNYVAIDDGAFFNDLGDIQSFKPLKFRVPAVIVADRKENFFQTFGHELLNDSRGPGGFMEGTEFHGTLDGFNNQDMRTKANMLQVIILFSLVPGSGVPSLLPLRVKIPFAGRAHEAAHKDADPLIDAVVKSLIKP